jgi:macrolide-specific efflux system membrane fusion protein
VKKSRILIGSAIAVAVIVIVIVLVGRSSNNRAVYKEVAVKKGDIDVTVLSTGIVQPENRLEIKPPIAGRVDAVFVDEGEHVKKGQKLVEMSSAERAALLDAAAARGPAELKKWQAFYKPAPILAPIDGTIILRAVEPGQSFTTSDAILVMSDRLTVKAQVDETDIAEIELHQKADVILDAYPDDDIPAAVDQIAYDSTTINNVTTYIVDVLPDNTPDFMRSGMTANVRFAVASKSGVLVLPNAAIRVKEGRAFVLLKPESRGGAPLERQIETGITNGKVTEIISGLNEGDVVLVEQAKKAGEAGSSSPMSPFGPPRRR